MTLCLTSEELHDLTARSRPAAQERQLQHLGIPCRRRSDGSIVVLRIHVERLGLEPADTLPASEPQLRF